MSQTQEQLNVLKGIRQEAGLLKGFQYDEIDFSPSSAAPTTITYKLLGVTKATLTLTYSGSDITSIVRS